MNKEGAGPGQSMVFQKKRKGAARNAKMEGGESIKKVEQKVTGGRTIGYISSQKKKEDVGSRRRGEP